jgi:hypothetical protein
MYKPSTYLVVTYFLTYLPMYETYFLHNWLSRLNQILTQLGFIHNWVIMGVQWMVPWRVLVHLAFTHISFNLHDITSVYGQDQGWFGEGVWDHKIRGLGACSGQVPPLKLGMSSLIHAWALTIIKHKVKVIVNLNMHRSWGIEGGGLLHLLWYLAYLLV